MSDHRTGLALSIRQPWAWLIIYGHKDIENRTWRTDVRGWVGIHASKTYDVQGDEWVRENFPDIILPPREEIQQGGIVGRARVIDCVGESASRWFFGPYGFQFLGAEPLAFMPMRGRLGFFRWAEEEELEGGEG